MSETALWHWDCPPADLPRRGTWRHAMFCRDLAGHLRAHVPSNGQVSVGMYDWERDTLIEFLQAEFDTTQARILQSFDAVAS